MREAEGGLASLEIRAEPSVREQRARCPCLPKAEPRVVGPEFLSPFGLCLGCRCATVAVRASRGSDANEFIYSIECLRTMHAATALRAPRHCLVHTATRPSDHEAIRRAWHGAGARIGSARP